jgi:hypothetical protein
MPTSEEELLSIAGFLNGWQKEEMVTLDEATALVPMPPFRPDVALASDASIRDVWVSTDKSDPQLFVRYQSCIWVESQQGAGAWSNKEWASSLGGDGIDGSMETIAGIDVFIVPQQAPSLGSARFLLDDFLVMLVGHGDFPVDELRHLAESVITGAGKARQEKAALS